MKQNICSLIILSFLTNIGCSDIVLITKDEFEREYYEDRNKREIYITLKDSARFHFLRDSYYIQYDTFYGEGKQIDIIGKETPIDAKIPTNDIDYYEGLKFNFL